MNLQRWSLLVCGALLALVGAAWFDLVPGGWRLRRLAGFDEAVARYERERAARRAAFRAEPVPPDCAVFLGSSTIERWDLRRSFPGLAALNRGIGNEPLAGLDARLLEDLPESARVAVLYAGSVDFRRGSAEAQAALPDSVDRLLARLGSERPRCRVVLLGLLPERDMPRERVEALARANAHLAAHAEARGAIFVETNLSPLANAEGSLSEDFSSDALHLSDEGYAQLSRWTLPFLAATNERTPPR
jgi:lysophospholipase L1-like esterase